jgi:CheY-like chemotaxis protein
MKKIKILVIDDEEGFTSLIKTTLEERDKYEVRTENNASLAIAAIREFRPDLVLLDIMMPGDIDGSEIARQIEGDVEIKNIPVVFLTAIVTGEEIDTGGGFIGGYPFIEKPINIKKLIDYIEKRLS